MCSPKILLLLAVVGSAHSAVLAQRPAIAPLLPLTSRVAVPQSAGSSIEVRPPARPAAPTAAPPARAVLLQPVYLINSLFIVGPAGLKGLKAQDIADLHVYKDADVPARWRGLGARGIIDIRLKPHAGPRLRTKPLAAIGRGLKLRGAVSYQLEGLPLSDLSLRIATTDIASLDTQPAAGGTVVNIHLVVPPPVVHPPGTILIRGVAGL